MFKLPICKFNFLIVGTFLNLAIEKCITLQQKASLLELWSQVTRAGQNLVCISYLPSGFIDRPGVAGAVLQTALLLIH